MNCDTIRTTLLHAGAVFAVRDGRLIIHVDEPLSGDVLNVLRHDRSEIIERWHERAAIREFDGGYQQTEAESLASEDLLCLDSSSRS